MAANFPNQEGAGIIMCDLYGRWKKLSKPAYRGPANSRILGSSFCGKTGVRRSGSTQLMLVDASLRRNGSGG